MTAVPELAPPAHLLRDALASDAGALARIHRTARAAAMPWLPVLHTPEETLRFFRSQVLPNANVTVLTVAAHPVAFIACRPGWVDHLYVAPGSWRRGYGAALLAAAKLAQTRLELWTFQANGPARAFYAAMGFREIEFTDGGGNEERAPDVRLAWP